tara:strand:+ start:109 stop:750 length:642 start_codon:yes stop_codon:yes gene_type:complete
MKNSNDTYLFYKDTIKFIDSKMYDKAIRTIKKNIQFLSNRDDIALAFLNCGFLNDKLGKNYAAIKDFSESIYIENNLELLDGRSKDISFNGRSNSKYKNGDYRGAIEDKRKAKNIRLLESSKFSEFNNNKIDYKKIVLGTFVGFDLDLKYMSLIKVSEVVKSKYDLIEDYKKVINQSKKIEVIKKLEILSEQKYNIGDFKGSIKAIRRSEKYY